MLRALLRKIGANFKSRWFPTLMIFMILLAAAVTSSLAISIQQSTDKVWERTFSATNGAHLWFVGSEEAVDLAPIGQQAGVTATAGPHPIARGFSLSRNNDKFELLILGLPAELPAINVPQLTEGRWLAAGATAETVLDYSLARDLNIKVGEQIEIPVAGGVQLLNVVGLAVNTIQGPFPNWSPGLIYVMPETIPLLAPDAERRSTMIGVQLSNPQDTDGFIALARQALPERSIAASIDWQYVQEVVGFSTSLITAFLGVFSLFALVAVGLIITNTISGTVLAQYREIGLLKAIGWKPSQVTFLFLCEYLLIGLFASALGIVASIFIVPIFLQQVAELLNTTAQTALDPLLFILVPGLVLLAVTVAALLPAWRGGRVPTVKAITVGYERIPKRPSRLGRIGAAIGLSPIAVLGIKDAFARPVRALLTVLSLTLTVMTVVFTLNMEASIQNYEANPALLGLHYDLYAERGFLEDSAAQAIFRANADVSAFYSMRFISARSANPAITRPIQTRAISGDIAQFPIVQEGRMFGAAGEAIVGQGLLDTLNLKIGDALALTVNDKPLNLVIVGRYIEPDNGGRMAMYSLDTFNQQMGETREPNLYALKLKPEANKQAAKDALLAASDNQMRVLVQTSTLTRDAGDLRMIMWGFSLALLLVGIVNLFNTTSLGVRERLADFGSLKTIGLTPWQIVGSVLTSMLFLTFFAILIGVPLGLVATDALFTYIGSTIGFGSIIASYDWFWLVMLIPLAIIITLLASALPARRAANVQIADAIGSYQ